MRLISCLAKQTTEGKWKPGLYDSTHRQTLHGKWRRELHTRMISFGVSRNWEKLREIRGGSWLTGRQPHPQV